MQLARKFPIYPNTEQQAVIDRTCAATRKLWNFAVSLQKAHGIIYYVEKALASPDATDETIYHTFNLQVRYNLRRRDHKAIVKSLAKPDLIVWLTQYLTDNPPQATWNALPLLNRLLQATDLAASLAAEKAALPPRDLGSTPADSKKPVIDKTTGEPKLRKIKDKETGEETLVPKLRGSGSLMTQLKETEEWAWLNDCPPQPLNVVSFKHLKTAMTRFYKREGGFPRFHSWRDKQTFEQQPNPSNKIVQTSHRYGKLSLPKLTNIRIDFAGHTQETINQLIATARTVTISKDKTGRYWASVVCQTPHLPPHDPAAVTFVTTEAIDRNYRDNLIATTDTQLANQHFRSSIQGRIAALTRKLQHVRDTNPNWKTSKRYEKLRRQLAKWHARSTNVMTDAYHKATTTLMHNPDKVLYGIEDLDIPKMVARRKSTKKGKTTKRQRKHRQNIQEARWGRIKTLAEYKAIRYGKTLVTLPRDFPSSKLCSSCNQVSEAYNGQTIWTCENCGTKHDRYTNTNINIRREALQQYEKEQAKKQEETSQGVVAGSGIAAT